jgi:metallo-beta-lactamase family protein
VLVLSHAHIDHSGLIPSWWPTGFRGIIWSTPATRDLCAIMLEDSAHIQETAFAFDERRCAGARPLCWTAPVRSTRSRTWQPAMARFQCMDYNEQREIVPGVKLTFKDAGHILGSAFVHLVIDDGERVTRLTFSGDIGRYVDRLLPDPVPLPPSDVLICESTYGDRAHAPMEVAHDELLGTSSVYASSRRGKLIIPAFSIGKTQELLSR